MPESTEPKAVAAPTTTVTLAWPYDELVDGEIVTHDPDTDLELPEHEANRLLLAGLARLAADPVPPQTPGEILAAVGTDPELAAAALVAEQANARPRTALIKKLELVITNAGKDN